MLSSTSKLQQLDEAIKNDDYLAAKDNRLWHNNINSVLANNQSILQMCADAGALRCFWHAILDGASLEGAVLENRDFEFYPPQLHPLTLTLENHHNLLTQMIIILRDPRNDENGAQLDLLNKTLQQLGLLNRMPRLKHFKKNTALIESLIVTLISESNHTMLLRKIIKFTKTMQIPQVGFEQLAFLAITLKKIPLFNVFMENDLIKKTSFDYLEESFLYRALKCGDQNLIENLIQKGHDYAKLYPYIIGQPDERKLLSDALGKQNKPLPQLEQASYGLPVNPQLTEYIYGIGTYENTAPQLNNFWSEKNFLAFYRHSNSLSAEDKNTLFLKLMNNDLGYSGVSYYLALTLDANYRNVPKVKKKDFDYLTKRSDFGLSPLDFLIDNIKFYIKSNGLNAYLDYFQLDLNTITLRCVRLSNFPSLKALLNAIEPIQRKSIIQSLLSIEMPMVSQLVTDLLLGWKFILHPSLDINDDTKLPLPYPAVEELYNFLKNSMAYDSSQKKERYIHKFRVVSKEWLKISYTLDGNSAKLYEIYDIEKQQLQKLVDTLANIKQSKFRYLPKTLMTVQGATNSIGGEMISKLFCCCLVPLPNRLSQSPAFQNLSRVFLPLIAIVAGLMLDLFLIPLIAGEFFDTETNPSNDETTVSAAGVFSMATTTLSVMYIGLLSLAYFVIILWEILRKDHHHRIPANQIGEVNRLAASLDINLAGQTVEQAHRRQSHRLADYFNNPDNISSLELTTSSTIRENPYTFWDKTPVAVELPNSNASINTDFDVEKFPGKSNSADEKTSLLNNKRSSRCSLQ